MSPVALIAVSIAGICGFALPNRDLAEAVRLWRLILAGTAAVGGLFGVTVGLISLLIHLSGLTCLGVPYLAPFSQMENVELVRKRLLFQKYRQKRLRPADRRRQK